MSVQELGNYGKPVWWTSEKWAEWQSQLHAHFQPASKGTVQQIERLRAFDWNGPILTVVEFEGKQYKGILFEVEGEE